MAAVFLNDLSANPWVIAETGTATDRNVKVASFTLCEAQASDHVADLSDSHGRSILQLNDQQRSLRFDGWVHGLSVDRLDSGYVVVALRDA